MVKVNIIFHSIHAHTYKMAEVVAAGAREVEGAEAGIYQCLRLRRRKFWSKWEQ